MAHFASTADLGEADLVRRDRAGRLRLYRRGRPEFGVVVGDEGVLVFDAQATPAMAGRVIERIRRVTDKPVTHVVLSHYHAVRVLGASAYGASNIVASDLTRALIAERGEQDKASEIGRFPRLFQGAETIAGLTWPTLTFATQASLWLGRREVRLIHLGRGHTMGDIIAYIPDCRVIFAGDLVEYGATPYCGDAHFGDWPETLERLAAFETASMVPGRGPALTDRLTVQEAIEGTRDFVRDLNASVREGVAAGLPLRAIYEATRERLAPRYGHWVIFEHCLPFNVSRAHDEALGHDHPRIWTDARDREMWAALTG